jgi:hypothetical protein
MRLITTAFLKQFFIAVIFLFVSIGSLKASHEAGGEITYTCIGPNQYAITLTLYRDCAGISSPNTYIMNYSSVACGVNSSITLNRQTTLDITPLYPTATSLCNGGGGSIGFEVRSMRLGPSLKKTS